jgi:hypothetical protein
LIFVDLPVFQDDIFDTRPADWIVSHSDEHFTQRYLQGENLIYCETLMTVRGTTDTEAGVAMVMGPWDWWEHGRITDFTRNEDGSTYQILSPVWWFITRVGLHIFPPVDLPDLKGRRVPLVLEKDFKGPSSMDVYPNPRGDGMIIRGRFHGVEYDVGVGLQNITEGLHIGAESGTMPPPFPKGTGWVGLLQKLETRAVVGNTIGE